ncbi:MAG: PAS domain S-box protein [Proteobacteria bacterium]|nr:PAS domain S-box protein [Pseudomonadota bacterium]
MEKDKIIGSILLQWITIFFLVAIVFISLGSLYYRYEAQRIKDDKYEDLSTIAKLKADSIQDWRKHRLADVRRVPGPLVRKEMARLLHDPTGPGARTALQTQLNINKKGTVYADALFLDTKGNILLSDNPYSAPVDQTTMRAIELALKDRREVLSDFFRDPKGLVCIDAVAPVPDDSGKPIAIVVLRSKAADFLFPLIQTWPTPSKTAETLLVCRDGDSILFLNDLRHRSDTALNLRFPLSNTTLPAVQAVLGEYGSFFGRDYRGIEVLAILLPVPQSPWFVVAKVDAEEILAEIKYRAWVITIIVILLMLIAAGLISGVYQKRQEVERKLAEDVLKESESRFRIIFESSKDGIILFDGKTKNIIHGNNAMAELLGCFSEDLVGRSISSLHPAEEWSNIKHELQKHLSGELSVSYGIPVIRIDSSVFYADISSSLITLDEKAYFSAFFRDITERKLAEETIKSSLREKEILLKEIQHRVKNNLLAISGILALQLERIKDSESKDAFITSMNRIKAMTKIHNRLYQSEDFSLVGFKKYMEELLWELSRTYGFPQKDIITDIQDISIDINTAIPAGLIINELVSNAMKHAFPPEGRGTPDHPQAGTRTPVQAWDERNQRAEGEEQRNVITVTLKKDGENDARSPAKRGQASQLVTLTVSDNGIGFPAHIDIKNTESVGFSLLVQLVEQINGTIELIKENGTRFTITFSIDQEKTP